MTRTELASSDRSRPIPTPLAVLTTQSACQFAPQRLAVEQMAAAPTVLWMSSVKRPSETCGNDSEIQPVTQVVGLLPSSQTERRAAIQ